MLTILAGTNRPGSTTRKLTTYVASVYQTLSVSTKILDLMDIPIEAFAPAAYETKPAGVQPMIDTVLGATGIVVITPEYNGGCPGVLKYFIDMLPHPIAFQNKPVCFIGVAAGEWGALRPVEQLQGIFSYRGAHQFPERVFVKTCHKQLDPYGVPIAEDLQKRFIAQAEGFLGFVKRFQGV